ncbi:hypothetical protein K1X84_09995 [bacterium]|nr:hypothetical protein [bacterium]
MHDIDRTLAELEQGPEGSEFDVESDFEQDTFETGEADNPLSEVEEMEMAAELLEITDEAELDQFFGKLFKKVGKFMKSPTGKMLAGVLKQVAKKALPIAGTALGGFVGGPVGASLGAKLAPMAGKMFGLELEGMTAEDQEFETARRFVRFASAATKKADDLSQKLPSKSAAISAIKAAARHHAPGLMGIAAGSAGNRTGRWIRRGRKIIILGV